MGNWLFREAKKAIFLARMAQPVLHKTTIRNAQAALPPAQATPAIAEKVKLQSFQDELESIGNN